MRGTEAEQILDAVTAQGFNVVGQAYTLDALRQQLARLAVEIRCGNVQYRPACEAPRAFVNGAIVEEAS